MRQALQSATVITKWAVTPDLHYFIKENSNEYLHEFNYEDFRLVKKGFCVDERNTYWFCPNEFFELASILT